MSISNREVIDEFKEAQAAGRTGGSQAGGGPSAADQDASGGSSGTGGYGKAQNQSLHQGQEGPGAPLINREEVSRGERFDLEQGGGRGIDALDSDGDDDAALDPDEAIREDQQEHQDQGQRWIEEHGDGPGTTAPPAR
jgi:hypothetical protein